MGMISSSKSVIGSSKSVIGDNPSVLGNSSVIAGSGVSPDFVFDVDTTNAGTLSDEFQLPLVSAGTLDFTISHPDLINSPITITAFNDAATLLTFNTGGIKTGITCVANNGSTISGWTFNNSGDRAKLLDVSNYGQFEISESSAFYGCTNIVGTATDAPLITTTNLDNTCRDCPAYTGLMEDWPTGSVLTFKQFLFNSTSFNSPLNNLDTSSGTNFQNMLRNTAYNQPLNDLSTGSMNTITEMMRDTPFNQDISGWDISSLTVAVNFMQGNTAFDQTNLDLLLPAWEGKPHNNSVTIHFGTATYSAGAPTTAYNILDVTDLWTITSGGPA